MSAKQSNRSRSNPAVLYVNTDSVEWYQAQSEGESLYGRAEVQGPGPDDIVEAALAAVAAAGAKRRPCVLALGDNLVAQRLMSLPPLSKAELKTVLLRKAASELECTPEDTAYAAREFGQAGDKENTGQWLLLGMRRSLVSPLRLALRSKGFDVKRVVATRLGGVCEVHSKHISDDKAGIVISVEPDSVSVSLVAEDALLNQNVLRGSLVTNPQMAGVLIQEIRSYDVFWRKQKRGEAIERIGIIGLGKERGEVFALAVRAAMPDTEVDLILDHDDVENAGRCESLAACLARGPLSLDLTIPVPARHAVVAAVLSSLAVMTLGIGFVTHGRLSGDIDQVQASIDRLLRESADLDAIETELQEERGKIARVDEAVDSILSVREGGIPLSDALADVFGAFRSRARILTLSTARIDSGGQVVITGTTDGNPLKAYAALESIRTDLEASPHFSDVVCNPAGQLPSSKDDSDSNKGLDFKISAFREDL